MFHLEATYVQNCQKIDIMDVDDHNVMQEDVEELVEADDEDDYIDDDDDDIAFNPYNVESGSDDTDADLDTDEDDHELH